MKKSYIANLGMNRTSINYLDARIEIVKKYPAFFKQYEGLKVNVGAIEGTAIRSEFGKRGVIDTKRNTRGDLQEQTLTISALVTIIALEKKDSEMYKRVYCTSSLLNRKNDEEMLQFARNMLDDMQKVKAELADLSVSADVATSYEESVNDFAAEIGRPQAAGRTKKAQDDILANLFRENRFIHDKKMKPLARLFKKEEPEFYAGYIKCLRLQDPRTAHSQAAGTLRDKKTGKALRDVTVRTEDKQYSTLTNRLGKYKLLIPVTGFYTLIFEKEGYQPVIIKEVEIRNGEIVIVDALLELAGS